MNGDFQAIQQTPSQNIHTLRTKVWFSQEDLALVLNVDVAQLLVAAK